MVKKLTKVSLPWFQPTQNSLNQPILISVEYGLVAMYTAWKSLNFAFIPNPFVVHKNTIYIGPWYLYAELHRQPASKCIYNIGYDL